MSWRERLLVVAVFGLVGCDDGTDVPTHPFLFGADVGLDAPSDAASAQDGATDGG